MSPYGRQSSTSVSVLQIVVGEAVPRDPANNTLLYGRRWWAVSALRGMVDGVAPSGCGARLVLFVL